MRSERLAAFSSLPWNGLYTAIFNTGIAAVLTAVGFGGGFVVNFVYSQCIGLSAWLLTDGTRRLLWPGKIPPWGPMMALATGSLFFAWLGGSWLAALLCQTGRAANTERSLTVLLITAAAGFTIGLLFREREKVAHLEVEAARERGRAETVERQIAQARLKLLQAQIEPHFLFNTLANLHALIPVNPARAQVMLDELNDFLRAAFAAVRKERNTLADEFALLRAYLEIIGIRMGERLRFRLELPESLADLALPPMLLQPLVENAVKHGVEPKIEGGEVTVRASAEDSCLVLTVADTGLGRGASDTAGTGAGVAHVRERLSGVYGDAASLELADNPAGGVTATLRLPLGK